MALALVGGVHSRSHCIEGKQLLGLQPEKRRHVRPLQAAQFTNARARLGVRQQSLLLLCAYNDVDAIAAVTV
jgi:hypothetical protein